MSDNQKNDRANSLAEKDSEIKSFKPSPEFKKSAHISSYSQYKSIYEFSKNDPERFWSSEAKELHWFKPWKEIKKGSASAAKWFAGGKTNITFNCLDRFITGSRKNKAALIWEGENSETRILTYQLLHTQVSKLANTLKKFETNKNDSVLIYMGALPEAVIAALACARIGAVYSFVYHGLSSHALEKRILKTGCKLIITQDYMLRKGNKIPLKKNVDDSISENSSVEKIIVFRRFESTDVKLNKERDFIWQDVVEQASAECQPAILDSQHPLLCSFTNKMNGELLKIFYPCGGYMVQSYLSAKWIYDLKENDIFWSSTDPAWMHTHSYGIYGALLNGITTFLFEGVPIYPEPDRYWQLISKFKINIFTTNPTTLRALLKLGDDWVSKHDLSSLKLLGTNGEPIKPETWLWFYNLIGKEKCPVVNMLLQTETGTALISTLPGVSHMVPGFTNSPFPGGETEIVNFDGTPVKTGESGYLILKDSIPSMFFTDAEEKSDATERYWVMQKNFFFTGDAALKEKNGNIKILGRVDDIIKVAGNRVCGTEIENALLMHEAVSEAAVVKRPDEIITDALIAFVTLKPDIQETPLLREELRNFVAERIGALAKPDELKVLIEIKKTENGKIDRKRLRFLAMEGTPPLLEEELEQFRILDKLREEFQSKYLR